MKELERPTQIAFAVLGLIAFTAGLVLLVQTALFVAASEQAMGRVASFETTGEGRSRFTRVHVRFEDARGQVHEAVTQSGSPLVNYRLGESVSVVYSPSAPWRARVETPFELWSTPLVFSGLGVLFLLIGGHGLLEEHRRERRGGRRPPAQS